MYIDEEKLGIYQAVKKRSEAIGIKKGEAMGEARGIKKGEARGLKKGEARGEARGLRKMVLRLLDKLPPEQVADLSGMSLSEVETIAAASQSS